MNRQIKFRAWDKNAFKMSDPFGFDGSTMVDFEGYSMPVLDIGESMLFALMQFTGLLDKNGKEIYERDVVKCRRRGDTEGEVDVFIEDIRILPTELSGSNLISREVIGNIYENPTLLTK